MATTHANKEVVWLQIFFLDIGFKQQPMRLDCGNQSIIFLENNSANHSKTKQY
jgi:hypothetical protein